MADTSTPETVVNPERKDKRPFMQQLFGTGYQVRIRELAMAAADDVTNVALRVGAKLEAAATEVEAWVATETEAAKAAEVAAETVRAKRRGKPGAKADPAASHPSFAGGNSPGKDDTRPASARDKPKTRKGKNK